MISRHNKKRVVIHITTYKNEEANSDKEYQSIMNDKTHAKPKIEDGKTNDYQMISEKSHAKRLQGDSSNFLCSICLKSNNLGAEFKNKSTFCCPVCRLNTVGRKEIKCVDSAKGKLIKKPPILSSKTVQTSQTDFNKDLNLLKEVLTVFQNNRQVDSKSVLTKEACVATDPEIPTDPKLKLSKSNVFRYSIDEEGACFSRSNFEIINCQPDNGRPSQFSINLSRRKSSSIPQMKLEELKFSLREKTKSKDAIEEVNRMFATVKRNDDHDLEESNRPRVRSGPRVLPVVKTASYKGNKKDPSETDIEKNIMKKNQVCNCCQTNNLQMSGGDSFIEHECCYRKTLCESKCDKCVYMLCCHYQKHKMDSACQCGNRNEKE